MRPAARGAPVGFVKGPGSQQVLRGRHVLNDRTEVRVCGARTHLQSPQIVAITAFEHNLSEESLAIGTLNDEIAAGARHVGDEIVQRSRRHIPVQLAEVVLRTYSPSTVAHQGSRYTRVVEADLPPARVRSSIGQYPGRFDYGSASSPVVDCEDPRRVAPIADQSAAVVDERFLAQVPNSPLKDSQRLVIRRADAEAALGDLAALVRGLAAS
jgi:hypothetical protein